MALQLPTAITFSTKLEGTGLDQLKRNLQGLAQQSNVSKRSLDQLYTATKVLGSASNNTVAGLQRTVGALKSLRDNAEFGSRKFRLLTSDIQAAEARLRRFQGAASASGGLSRGGALLAGAAGGVAGSLTTMAASGAMDAVRGTVQAGLAAETARVRLKALTDQFGEYNQAQAASARIAQTLRISQTEAEDAFSKLYAALRPTGVTLKEVEDAYIGFTAAARASGATATESGAALIQLKQALGSGVLQGDELRSIREQAPAVGQAIAKELGVTVGELKDLGSQGKITTDVVLKALARLKGEKLDDLNAQFNTGAQALKDLQIAAENVGKSLSRIFGPTALKVVKDFAAGLQDVASVLGALGGDKGAEAVLQDRIRARDRAAAEAGSRFGLFDLGGKEAFFQQRQEQLFQQLQRERAAAARGDRPNAAQQQAQDAAARERQQARERSAMEDAKKRLGEQLKIREDAEKRLADFREQSIQRAAQLERDLGDQRQELERSTAEARRRIAAQQQDFALEAERQKLRGAGLGTEALDTQARLNEATRRFTEQKIQIEQSATDRRVQIERTLEDYKLSVARGISEILQDAADKMAQKMLKGAQAAADATQGQTPSGDTYNQPGVGYFSRSSGAFLGKALPSAATGATSMGGGIGSGFTQQQLNSATQAASKFAGVANMCSESVKAFYKSLGITLPGVTAWADTVRKAGTVMRDWSKLKPGDIVATGRPGDTPHVGVYTGENNVFHQSRSRGLRAGNFPDLDYFKQSGYFVRPSSGTPMAGAASAAPAASASVDMSGVTAAGRRLDAASGANRSADLAAAAGDLVNSRQAELGTITSQLDQQRKSVREQREDFERMVELQRSGMSPELARQAVDRERAATSETASLQVLEQQLVKDLQSKDLTVEQRANVEAILKSTQDRLAAQPGIVQGLTEEERKLQQLQQAYEQKKQLVQGIADSIGGGISQALDLVINGTENWGDSLRSIAAGVLKDIARQLLQIMVIQPIVKGIAAGIGNLFPSANGNVFAPGGVVPYAMGGIVTRPTIFPFADGGGFRTGLMGEAGPEAIMPLKRGADGKLGVQIVNSNPQDIQAVKQPVAEAVLQPVVKSSIAAIKQPIAEAVLQPIVKSFIDAIKQPVAEAVLQPVIKSPVDAAKQPDAAMNTIRPFANGGIVDSPTLFKFANGGVMRDGLMGEAGPEAILPLKRGRGGKLGVAMQGEGGGSTNVTVNVDASGSQVQGDAGKGEQLGRVISQAVQAELIKQKRPGGLLPA
jgi:tape measure domain-containing protein